MKKTISFFLSVLLIICIAFAGTPVSAKTDLSKYQNKINGAINDCYACGDYYVESSDAGGFYYDFDGNGVKELVLTYFKMNKVNGYSYQHLVCSVYTIKNGKVKTVIKKKILYADAGGPFAAVGIAKKNGKKYLFCYDETGETGGGSSISRTGEIVLYKIKGAKATKKTNTKFNIKADTTKTPSKIKSSKIKQNGKKISYKKFIKWQKSLKLSKAKRNKGIYWKYHYNMKITSLLNLS